MVVVAVGQPEFTSGVMAKKNLSSPSKLWWTVGITLHYLDGWVYSNMEIRIWIQGFLDLDFRFRDEKLESRFRFKKKRSGFESGFELCGPGPNPSMTLLSDSNLE